MFRRVAIGLLVVGLGGCASQQTQPFAVSAQEPPTPYQQPAYQPPAYQQPAPQTSQWAPSTTQALPAQPVAQKLPAPGGDQAVVRQLISTSRLAFGGPCACPYDTDKAGRCGDRSAYSRGGHNKPLCFATDVTPEMIARQRKGDADLAHGTN